MQPSLDQLIQITRTLTPDYDFVRVVLASIPSDLQDNTQLDVQFIEVTDGPEFRTDLLQGLRDGLTALGLLGWEFQSGPNQITGSQNETALLKRGLYHAESCGTHLISTSYVKRETAGWIDSRILFSGIGISGKGVSLLAIISGNGQ